MSELNALVHIPVHNIPVTFTDIYTQSHNTYYIINCTNIKRYLQNSEQKSYYKTDNR